ncbi:succinate--CoA ligase [ADP-forming] subunit beta, mitochondrial isoform X2 [Chrysoperla carnea]|uniref:succinate--CoA ligase [ADP-forming] subunit beta, mitochondrial isoform X2 n=1 Tax=Chrysoperla carnea TaxID=189513 RepID=UPI001D0924FB|nr:succinate--CoA ligase [ADP-forming] subunit beta, mitochondrial isoform X2 [Chrysoperla carnea]
MATLLRRLSLAEHLIRNSQKVNWQIQHQQKRNLNVHEYVSYTLLKEANIPVPPFGIAKTKEEAKKIATDLNTNNLVLKAQVLAGGRGLGKFKNGFKGGVRMVETPEEAAEVADKMLGQLLVTKQTGEAGRICNSVMVTERKFPRKEYYIAIMMDRSFGGPAIIASSQGGVSIEDVAKENPEAIIYERIDIIKGLKREQAVKVAETIGLTKFKDQTADNIMRMYELFIKTDALLIEVNPYAYEGEDKFFCLDAKFRFDDNAEYRQPDIWKYRDLTQEDAKEVAASQFNLNYIALDGSIGCLVNGAGLAMATMDIIKLHGGSPANFLDVGGGATAKAVKEAFKIITADQNVHAILVNIFGGIMRCDIIAEGIIAAAKELNLKLPIVCRLQGTSVDEAKVLIGSAGLKILPVDNLDEAARLVVKLASIVSLAKSEKLDIDFTMPI